MARPNQTSRDWEQWATEHMDSLLLYARWQARSEQDAKDILQNAFLETWKKFETLSDNEYHALLCKKIKHRTIDYYRSKKSRNQREIRHHTEQNTLAPHHFDPTVENSATTDEKSLLIKALQKLKPELQEIIILHLWNNQSIRQIAATLETPKSTIQSRYQQAISKLQQLYPSDTSAS